MLKTKLTLYLKILTLLFVKKYWLCAVLKSVGFVLNFVSKIIMKQVLDTALAFFISYNDI